MQKTKFWVLLSLLVIFVLSACGPSDEATPTQSVGEIQTVAVMAYQAQLTQTAQAMPTATFTPEPTETPIVVVTFASPEAALPTNTQVSDTQSTDCYDLSYVRDVTIPDNTVMTPGQTFTKTWLVSNTGTCAWESGFVFNVVGGEAMSGASVTLNQTVDPGRQYEFSVPMVAPADITGEIKGTWQLSDANGNFFGDGVYVLIEIPGGETPTPTP
jgi:hypothetical protein